MKLLFLCFLITIIKAYSIKDKYCGELNCFQILRLHKNATSQEIKKSFRELSREFHPDKGKIRGENTNSIYQQMVQAYEVLNKEETRQAYLDYLLNPDQNEIYHYYRYYQQVYMPQTNPFVVLAGIIISLALIQYTARYGMYKQALGRVTETSQFRRVLNEKYNDAREKDKNITKDQVYEDLLKTVNVHGAWSKPQLKDVWFISITLFFYRIFIFKPYFYFKWKKLYQQGQREVPYEDGEIKTKQLLLISDSQWLQISEDERMDLVERKLWICANMNEYRKEQKEKYQEYLEKHSGKMKMMKRWVKKNK